MNGPTRPLRVVAADCEPDMRRLYEEALPRLGHEVIVAGTAPLLAQLCQSLRPDLVVTEAQLPDGDGLRAVEACPAPTPIVLVANSADPDLVDRALHARVWGYLVKPVDQDDLVAAIDLAARRFAEHQALLSEAAGLRLRFEEEARAIAQGKRAVRRLCGADECEAGELLEVLSGQRGEKIDRLARALSSAEDLLNRLERL